MTDTQNPQPLQGLTWSQLIAQTLVIPTIMAAIRAHYNATNGTFPTEEQVIAALPALADSYIDRGKAFLERIAREEGWTGGVPPVPVPNPPPDSPSNVPEG